MVGAALGANAGGSVFGGVAAGSADTAAALAGPSCALNGSGEIGVGIEGSLANGCSGPPTSGEVDATIGPEGGLSGGPSVGVTCVLFSTDGFQGCGAPPAQGQQTVVETVTGTILPEDPATGAPAQPATNGTYAPVQSPLQSPTGTAPSDQAGQPAAPYPCHPN